MDPVRADKCEKLWRKAADASAVSFFQTWEWAEIVARHFPFLTPSPIIGKNWFIPLMRMHRWGWLSDSLYGMPFMTPGGFHYNGIDWDEIYTCLASQNVGTTVIVFPPGVDIPFHPGFRKEIGTTHIVDLQGGWDAVWGRYLSAGRRATRKAIQNGVTVKMDKSIKAIKAHWEILKSHFPLWKPNPPPTYEFIKAAVESESGRLYIAEHEGRVVGSKLLFVFSKEIVGWQAPRTLDSPPIGTSNLLTTHALQEACREGCTHANLGASIGSRGIESFKEAFGGKKSPYVILKRIHPWLRPLKGG